MFDLIFHLVFLFFFFVLIIFLFFFFRTVGIVHGAVVGVRAVFSAASAVLKLLGVLGLLAFFFLLGLVLVFLLLVVRCGIA